MSETAKPLIYGKIAAIMKAVDPIAKSQKNTEQKYNFRGVDQVYNECHPHFAEQGVFSVSTLLGEPQIIQGTTSGGKSYHILIQKFRFTFYAEDGSCVSTEVIGEGMDYSGDKAANKAMSAADKYALLQLLKIPTACVDSDKAPGSAPDHDGSQPSAQPRDQRGSQPELEVSQDDLSKLAKLFRETVERETGERPSAKSAFEWVQRVGGLDVSVPFVAEEWTKAAFDKCMGALTRE